MLRNYTIDGTHWFVRTFLRHCNWPREIIQHLVGSKLHVNWTCYCILWGIFYISIFNDSGYIREKFFILNLTLVDGGNTSPNNRALLDFTSSDWYWFDFSTSKRITFPVLTTRPEKVEHFSKALVKIRIEKNPREKDN